MMHGTYNVKLLVGCVDTDLGTRKKCVVSLNDVDGIYVKYSNKTHEAEARCEMVFVCLLACITSGFSQHTEIRILHINQIETIDLLKAINR